MSGRPVVSRGRGRRPSRQCGRVAREPDARLHVGGPVDRSKAAGTIIAVAGNPPLTDRKSVQRRNALRLAPLGDLRQERSDIAQNVRNTGTLAECPISNRVPIGANACPGRVPAGRVAVMGEQRVAEGTCFWAHHHHSARVAAHGPAVSSRPGGHATSSRDVGRGEQGDASSGGCFSAAGMPLGGVVAAGPRVGLALAGLVAGGMLEPVAGRASGQWMGGRTATWRARGPNDR